MAKRLIALDYDAVRAAFDEEYKATRKLIERKDGGQAPQGEKLQ